LNGFNPAKRAIHWINDCNPIFRPAISIPQSRHFTICASSCVPTFSFFQSRKAGISQEFLSSFAGKGITFNPAKQAFHRELLPKPKEREPLSIPQSRHFTLKT